MSIVSVVAQVTARPGSIEALKSNLMKMIAPTRSEEGCIEYRLHQDNENPAVFVFYENWKSLADLELHMNTPHFQEYVVGAEALIAGVNIAKLTEVA